MAATPHPEPSRDITLVDLERSISSIKPLFTYAKAILAVGAAIAAWGWRNELRLRDLETWRLSALPVERYHNEKEKLTGDLSSIKERLNALEKAYTSIDSKLDRILSK